MFLKSVIVLIVVSTVSATDYNDCILPDYPAHGTYKVAGEPNAEPKQALDTAYLNVSCDPGYYVTGKNFVFCVQGLWSNEIPKCVRSCKLVEHPSVTYRCKTVGSDTTVECGDYVPAGTAVLPACARNYFLPGILNTMTCVDGSWDYVAHCIPDCGKATPEQSQAVNGRQLTLGEAPWHVAIYKKTYTPYLQLCTGSLVTPNAIISVAHCFWDDIKKMAIDPSNFAAAVGKVMRPWDADVDSEFAQKRDVLDIKLPSRYQGNLANYQDDIALVTVASPYQFDRLVRPVCLDFDYNFDERQLADGNVGKVPAWNHSQSDSPLQLVNMNSLSIEKCIIESPAAFREFITSDKICGVFDRGVSEVKGNSGAGVVFPEMDRGAIRFYLRGVLSTAPVTPEGSSIATFTQILKHENFLKNYV